MDPVSSSNNSIVIKVPNQKPDYLEMAVESLKNVPNTSSEKLVQLARIGKAMQKSNPEKASQLFQQIYKNSEQLGKREEDLLARAYIMYTTQSPEKVKQDIAALENTYHSRSMLNYYIRKFGKLDPSLVECCKQKFISWNVTNDMDIKMFAHAFIDLDFDTFLEMMQGVKEFATRANDIIFTTIRKKKPISKELLNTYINLVDQEIEQRRGTIALFILKVKCCTLRGMNSQEVNELVAEVDSWKKYVGKNDFNWDEAIKDLAEYLKKDHFQKALDLSLMLNRPEDLKTTLFEGITPDSLEFIEKYIEQLKDPYALTDTRDFIKIRYWLYIASQMSRKYPETVKKLLPKLIDMIEKSPDSEEMDWQHGNNNRRRDAHVSHVDKKREYIQTAAELCSEVKEFDKAKQLLEHKLIQTKSAQTLYNPKDEEAKYNLNEPEQAEKYYEEQLVTMEKVNSYEIDNDTLKKRIANGMLKLNPERALEIVLGMRETYNKIPLLFNFAKETLKSNAKFAEKCIESMPNGDTVFAKYKAKGYLKLFKSHATRH